MKKIRNWKVIKDNLDFLSASNMYKNQAINGTLYDYIAIRIGHRIFTPDEIIKFESETFYPKEILSNDWVALIPDTDEECKNEKIRRLMKDSCCSRLKNDKIDNMTIPQIWEWVSDHLDKDQMYRMLLAYYDQKIYKTK